MGARSEAQWPSGPELLKGVASLAAWMVASTALIVFNKRAFEYGFEYPATLTALNQLACVFGGLALGLVGLSPLGKPPSLEYTLTRVLPFAIANAVTLICGASAYLYLSVSFIQILKAFTPAVTMAISLALGLEKTSFPLVTSLGLLAFGGVAAAMIESGAPSFHMTGFLLFMASSISEALRVGYIRILLGSSELSMADALVYQGFPSMVLLSGVAIVTESTRIVEHGLGLIIQAPIFYVLTFSMSFFVQLFTFLAIDHTSPLTLKVGSCSRNSLLIWWGIMRGEQVSFGQIMSYFVSLVGLLLFAYARRFGSVDRNSEGTGKQIKSRKKLEQDQRKLEQAKKLD